jgi:hypothetical protein
MTCYLHALRPVLNKIRRNVVNNNILGNVLVITVIYIALAVVLNEVSSELDVHRDS